MVAYTVIELRDRLNELIELGYGEIQVYKNGDYVAQEEVDMVGIYGLKCVIMNHWMDEWIQTKQQSLQMIKDRMEEIIAERELSCSKCKLCYKEEGDYPRCRKRELNGDMSKLYFEHEPLHEMRYICFEDNSHLTEFSKLQEYYSIMKRKVKQEKERNNSGKLSDWGLGEAVLENNSHENYNKLNNGE